MSRSFTLIILLIVAIIALLMIRGFNSDTKSTEELQPLQGAAIPVPEENFQNWREFTSTSGHFKVLLPALPQHIIDKLPDAKTGEMRKYETFIAADEHGAAFMISAITLMHNVESDSDDESLKSAIGDILARNKENKLKEMKKSSYRNSRSLDFSISSNDVSIAGKVFAQNNTIYVLSMINRSEFFNPKELAFFINSFDLLSDEKSSTPATAAPAKMPVKK